MALSITERQKKLETIAAYDITVLRMSTNKELSELCKDMVTGYARMTKEEKLQALFAITKPTRETLEKREELEALRESVRIENERNTSEITAEKVAIAKDGLKAIGYNGEISNDPDNDTNLGAFFYARLRNDVDRLLMANPTDYRTQEQILVARIAAEITQHESSREKTNSIHTRKNRRCEILKAMKCCLTIESENNKRKDLIEVLTTAIAVIDEATYAPISAAVSASNAASKLASNQRNESPEKITVSRYFEDAYKTLNNLDSKDVSREAIYVALAIVTGRRPSEIYCSGKFAKHSDHWITFQGQNKKKSQYVENEEFILPTLCKADLVIKAIDKLESMVDKIGEPNGRYPFDATDKDSRVLSNKRADSKFSKPLSRYLAYKNYDFTCREFRAMYGEISYKLDAKSSEAKEIHKVNDPVQGAWFRIVLGHEESSDANSAYTKFHVIDEDVVLSMIQSHR